MVSVHPQKLDEGIDIVAHSLDGSKHQALKVTIFIAVKTGRRLLVFSF